MSTSIHTSDDLRELAAQGAVNLEGASASELLRWTEETFGDSYIVASNMQDGALVHLAAQVHPGVDVLFLETGYHFAETLEPATPLSRCTGSTSSTPRRSRAWPSRMHCWAKTSSHASPTSAAACGRWCL